MRVTILETGRAPEPLRPFFPDYPAMFRALLGPADPVLSFETVAICDGAPTPPLRETQAVLITGSPAGAYDPEPWIPPLEAFIRAAAAAEVPMVGVCFGHQIMAQALGGRVRKSEKGWGVGRHVYDVVASADWMAPGAAQFAIGASHQDQVTEAPPHAKVIARSDHTDIAALAYERAPAISFQGHPEMNGDFLAALIGQRRGTKIPEPVAQAGLASLSAPLDNGLVASWIIRFLRRYRA